ncbi:MAG: GldG family protein [Deltaproteobacteria bacterium]|nr:GldG family protein [Deltaproteobacteria bacterium]MBW2695802.1 GldG family protein [Deltaproteobacteria bacterium]
MRGLGSLLGGLGLVAVGFGLLSALLAIFQPITDLVWVIGNLVLGVVLLSAALFVSFDRVRQRLHSGEARRVGKYGTSALLSTLLIIALLGMFGFLTNRHSKRWDWTEGQVNTLSDQTLDLLQRLEADVVIRAFFLEGEAPAVAALLDRYAHMGERIELVYVDPNSVPILIEDLRLDPDALAKGLVRVEQGDAGIEVTDLTESGITNGLLRLIRSSEKKVYFLSGHNERPIADTDGRPASGKESMGRAAEALRNETYAVESLSLSTLGEIPEDADAVIVAGPTQPYFDHEQEALRRYLEGGGALFVMIDPRAHTNLHPLIESWGVLLGDDVVVDEVRAIFNKATMPLAAGYAPDHPITVDLSETTVFPMVRSVMVAQNGPGDFEPIVQTGAESWAERDLDGWRESGRAELGEGDFEGPVPIAVAGTLGVAGEPALAPRLVVVGDSDFASNEFLEAYRNRDFFVNSVNWLVGDVEQIGIRPRLSRASRFELDSGQFRFVIYLSLFILPEAIAVLGVVTWWLRRGRAEL